jgi:hypothetical protein
MKVGIAFSVPVTTAPGFGWRWRSEDHTRESSKVFVFYADCVADAERHGYKIKPVFAQGLAAPGRGFAEDRR